jgi:6-phosphogluconolactonase
MATTSAADSMLLVSASQDDKVVRFAIDEASGRLTPARVYDVPGGPMPMAISPDGRTLYVSLRGADRVASFRIEAQSGDLSPLNEIDVAGSATFIATDRTGRYLLSAYYAGGVLRVHGLTGDGSLGAHVQTVETAKNAHCVVLDRSNRFVFVPHTGAEAIFQFQFDAQSGRLTPHPAGHVDTSDPQAKWEPRHLWFHPTADFAYVSMEAGNAIGAFGFDAEKGTLTPLARQSGGGRSAPEFVSTLPQAFSGENTTAHIELTPDGRFAYVSNRGHDSIAGFQVDADTGHIRPTEPLTTPTEPKPRAFTIHPSGKWMYVAGQDSGRLASYRIGDDGSLTPMETHAVGRGPAWVQVVAIPAAE